MAKSKRIRKAKTRVDPVAKLALTIIPREQFRMGAYAIRDVANHSESDQRSMVRSGETRTVRRKTRIELMRDAGVITVDQASACEWYASNYELGFQTVGCTANYAGAGGGGFGSGDLLARYKAQGEARENFTYARLAIPRHLLDIFDAVTLGTGRPPHMMRKADKLRFSLAAFLLHGQIGHLLAIAA